MPDLLTPEERAELKTANAPILKCALLLEWVLVELRRKKAQAQPQHLRTCGTAYRGCDPACIFQDEVREFDPEPTCPAPYVGASPIAKRGPGRPRKDAGR